MTKKVKLHVIGIAAALLSVLCVGGVHLFKPRASEGIGEVPLPKHFMKDAVYSLDAVESGTVGYIRFDDGADFVEIGDLSYVDLSGAQSKVDLQFEKGGERSGVYSIPVVDVGFGATTGIVIENYFQATKGVFVGESTEDEVAYKTSSTENELAFINYLSLNHFNFDFAVESGKFNANGIKLTFTDYYDTERVEALTLYKKGGLTYLSNGETELVVGSDAKLTNTEIKKLSYEPMKGAFLFDGRFELPLTQAFKGDRVLFSLSFTDLTDECILNVYKVNNTDFYFNGFVDEESGNKIDALDSAAPQVSLKKTEGVISVNEKVVIAKPDYCDVLSPVLKKDVVYYVLGPNNESPVSVDGVKLDGTQPLDRDYELKLEQTGDYVVFCTVKDSSEYRRSGVASYTISSTDLVAPTLSLANDYDESTVIKAKVGDKITFAGYTVSDNYYGKEDLSVRVFVFEPTLVQHIMDGKTEYVLTKKGDYKIYYMALDGAGNYATKYYVVRAE